MKIPTWPCIGTGKWEMWLDSLFWTHLQSDVGENYQVWSLESVLSRDLTSVCDKFLFLALAVMSDIGRFLSFGLFFCILCIVSYFKFYNFSNFLKLSFSMKWLASVAQMHDNFVVLSQWKVC